MKPEPHQHCQPGAINCEECDGALEVTSDHLWHGIVICSYCKHKNVLSQSFECSDLADLNTGQRAYLSRLQRTNFVIDFDDFSESVSTPENSKMVVRWRPGQYFGCQRPWHSLGLQGLVQTFVSALLVAVGISIPVSFLSFALPLILIVALWIVAGATIIYLTSMTMFGNWTIASDGVMLHWTKKFWVFRRSKQVFVEDICNVKILEEKNQVLPLYKKSLSLVIETQKLNIAGELGLEEKQFLRAQLLGFLRTVSAKSLVGPLLQRVREIQCTNCTNIVSVAEDDSWRGIVTCPQCNTVTQLGQGDDIAPQQKQILQAINVGSAEVYLLDYDDDAPPPYSSVVDVEGTPGNKMKIVIPHSKNRYFATFEYLPHVLVGGAIVALAIRQWLQSGGSKWVVLGAAFGAVLSVAFGRKFARENSVETIELSSRTFVLKKRFLFFTRSKKILMDDISHVDVERIYFEEPVSIIKRCYLKTRKGPLQIGYCTDNLGAVYLRAAVAKHLRALGKDV